ncbi:amino acid ABC transporter permease [Kineosporia sp. J2-2]|uniref:Amino acid ABC transporter permease n=1 Tax=Kineosporia corallincola TaxID=2835133 RepID=A0ABS5TSR0_9ACTN|nr:amino acid ABC transporter permease [Kineosporia corallincola]MBT0773861.1 amino acid ABC transporter permease [Kineosporia corallincola]
MNVITDNLDLFFQGFAKTLGICIICMIGSLILGTLVAACRISPVAPLRGVGSLYVNFVRNCPLTVVLFFIAFGLPEIGINQSYYVFGCTALIIYTAAFVCEALRSGINAIPTGQAEAARAIGLTFGQNLREVVLPQAFRTAIPPVGSVIIAMFKNSAILGAFGVGGDLLGNAILLTSSRGQDPTAVYLGIGFFFLMITIPAGLLLQFLERKAAILR